MNNNHHSATSAIGSIIDFLIYSSLYRSIGAFCGAALVGTALGAPFDVAAYLLPALVSLAGYTFDNLADMRREADRVNVSARSLYFQRHERMSQIFGWGSLIATIIICLQRSLLLGIFLIALPVVLSRLYVIGWGKFFPKAKAGRLKDNIFAKPLIVGLGWGAIQVFAPAFYLNLPFSLWLFLLWGYVSWLRGVNSVINDIGDVEGDRKSGTRTFPVVYGPRNTVIALAVAQGLSLVWVASMSGIGWMAQIALCIGILFTFGHLYLSTRLPSGRIRSLMRGAQFWVIYLVFLLLQFFSSLFH